MSKTFNASADTVIYLDCNIQFREISVALGQAMRFILADMVIRKRINVARCCNRPLLVLICCSTDLVESYILFFLQLSIWKDFSWTTTEHRGIR